MSRQEATEEYLLALKQGQKLARELQAAGKNPYLEVLDEILPSNQQSNPIQVGTIEIPADRIVGTKSAGRIFAFTQGFLPLLEPDSEFAAKWVNLCAAHLSDTGIRDPIVCFEYLGSFYVQEGNKRVSVLRHFGAPRITGTVVRLLPQPSQESRIRAYYEFLDFYKGSRLYDVQFRSPGCYGKLLAFLGKEPGEMWNERERRTFSAYFQYFKDAFAALKGTSLDVRPEEALLLWLQINPFQELGKLPASELKKSLSALWSDVRALASPVPEVRTEPQESARGLLSRLITATPEHVNVAFVHQQDTKTSNWTKGHEEGRLHLEQMLPGRVTTRSYFHADSPERTEWLLEQAVTEGAQVVFTTAPQLCRATLKVAVKYPKVRFLNCSVNTPYSSIRTYYSRIYEGKFITGAIAGAMAKNDRIGYVGTYPIYGVPASINAFALGAQMTNPRAKVELRWACVPGTPVMDFVRDGIRVISNRDVPSPEKMYLEFGEYGTYLVGDNGSLTPLGSPCWVWGRFYENVIRSILAGTWEQGRPDKALNDWWGMRSGVIDVKLSDKLPDGLLELADILRRGLQAGTLDPFRRKLVKQDGTLVSDGNRSLTPDELLHMDYLCQNVVGSIPDFSELRPSAQSTVRELGIYQDRIPREKEGSL